MIPFESPFLRRRQKSRSEQPPPVAPSNTPNALRCWRLLLRRPRLLPSLGHRDDFLADMGLRRRRERSLGRVGREAFLVARQHCGDLDAEGVLGRPHALENDEVRRREEEIAGSERRVEDGRVLAEFLDPIALELLEKLLRAPTETQASHVSSNRSPSLGSR